MIHLHIDNESFIMARKGPGSGFGSPLQKAANGAANLGGARAPDFADVWWKFVLGKCPADIGCQNAKNTAFMRPKRHLKQPFFGFRSGSPDCRFIRGISSHWRLMGLA